MLVHQILFLCLSIFEHKMIQEKCDHNLSHIFSTTEQDICNKKATPSIHYSGKFAAKEAVKKAILSFKPSLTIALISIEIQNDDNGIPFKRFITENAHHII